MRITDVMVGVFFIAASIMPATADGKRVPFVAKPDVLPGKTSTVTSYAPVKVEGSLRRICAGFCYNSGGLEQPTNYWLCDYQDGCAIECAVFPSFGYCAQSHW